VFEAMELTTDAIDETAGLSTTDSEPVGRAEMAGIDAAVLVGWVASMLLTIESNEETCSPGGALVGRLDARELIAERSDDAVGSATGDEEDTGIAELDNADAALLVGRLMPMLLARDSSDDT